VTGLIACPQDAQDILQEGKIVMWRQFHQFELGTNFAAWARKILFYQILAYNATTIPEIWSGKTTINFPDPRPGGASHNHPAFGSVGAYFYKYLAGIQTDPQAVAFKHIIIKPHIEGDLTYARADYDSIRGTITSRWERQNASFIMNVSIPANTTATVWVPKDGRKNPTIKENGKSIWSAGKFQTGVDGIKSGNNKENYVVFNIGSGDYNFKVK
jgi:alpha-L-rhamnosidase